MWITSEYTKDTEQLTVAYVNYIFCYEVHVPQNFNISSQNVTVWFHISAIRKSQNKNNYRIVG